MGAVSAHAGAGAAHKAPRRWGPRAGKIVLARSLSRAPDLLRRHGLDAARARPLPPRAPRRRARRRAARLHPCRRGLRAGAWPKHARARMRMRMVCTHARAARATGCWAADACPSLSRRATGAGRTTATGETQTMLHQTTSPSHFSLSSSTTGDSRRSRAESDRSRREKEGRQS